MIEYLEKSPLPAVKVFPASFDAAAAEITYGEQPFKMHASDATARVLLEDESGRFGADLLRFPPNGGVPMHTHVGHHILLVLKGSGRLILPDGEVALSSGLMYFIQGGQPHEIHSEEELVLIAFGNDRRPVNSPARLDLVEIVY